MTALAATIAALSILWIGHVYVGFPLLCFLRALLARKPAESTQVTSTTDDADSPDNRALLPRLSIIICAYNEEAHIAQKICDLTAQDYPVDRLEIIIASDGSSDGTNAIVAACEDSRVRLLALPRLGKVRALNAAAAHAEPAAEVLVFSDANSRMPATALRALVAPLADPQVGGVAGDQRLLNDDDALGESTYWDFDRLLKRWQSAAGSVTSSTGALHALRRSLFEPIPEGITDDFGVSTLAVAAGKRLAFAEAAFVLEAPVGDTQDFGRRVRIMTRGLNGVRQRRRLLNPLRFGFYAHQLLVQKLLRRIAFVPLLLLLVSSAWLAGDYLPARVLFAAQALCYAAGLIGIITGSRLKPLRLSAYFIRVNAAAAVAANNVLRGVSIDTWSPRSGEELQGGSP